MALRTFPSRGILADIMWSTSHSPSCGGSTALIKGIPSVPLVFVNFLTVEVHSFAAVSAENLILKQIDKSGPYFLGLVHFRPAGVRRSFHDCLNTVKNLAAMIGS